MTAPPVRVERRVGQRFPFLLPVSLHDCSGQIQGAGFTQDLSSRGVFLFTDVQVTEGSEIELTLRMPSEITLGESMHVRCRGRVLRILKPGSSVAQPSERGVPAAPRVGVAVRFDSYEYLTEMVEPRARAASLHSNQEESHPVEPPNSRVVEG